MTIVEKTHTCIHCRLPAIRKQGDKWMGHGMAGANKAYVHGKETGKVRGHLGGPGAMMWPRKKMCGAEVMAEPSAQAATWSLF